MKSHNKYLLSASLCFINGAISQNLERITMQFSEYTFILKPSPIHGIGVFATEDIPAGTPLLNRGHKLRILKIKDVPPEFLTYCAYINECACPEQFDRMEIGWFINHSKKPNIASNEKVLKDFDIKNGSVPAYSFYAVRDIKAGEEILVDYNYLKEPENLKDEFYKQ